MIFTIIVITCHGQNRPSVDECSTVLKLVDWDRIGWSPGGVRLVVHQIMEGKMCSEGAKLSEKNRLRVGVCLVNMTTARRKNPGQPVQC